MRFNVLVLQTAVSVKQITVEVSDPSLAEAAALEQAPSEEFPEEQEVSFSVLSIQPLTAAAPSPQRPGTNTAAGS